MVLLLVGEPPALLSCCSEPFAVEAVSQVCLMADTAEAARVPIARRVCPSLRAVSHWRELVPEGRPLQPLTARRAPRLSDLDGRWEAV